MHRHTAVKYIRTQKKMKQKRKLVIKRTEKKRKEKKSHIFKNKIKMFVSENYYLAFYFFNFLKSFAIFFKA